MDLALLLYPITEVIAKLGAALQQSNTAVHIHVCRYVTRWGCSSLMLPLLEQSEGTDEDVQQRELAFFQAIMLMQTGEKERAESILQKLVQHNPQKHLILYWWALQNTGADSLVQLNLLYAFRESVPELAALADMLLNGHTSPAVSEQLLEQAAYASLMMRAWSGFQLVWQQLHRVPRTGVQTAVPRAWRPAIYQSPQHVRQFVQQKLLVEPREFGDQLFSAQLAYSLGEKEKSRQIYTQLKHDFPKRLEPCIGLYDVLNNSEQWTPFLFLADLQ
jgi:tetratricopeptide (TPR) repeat protein